MVLPKIFWISFNELGVVPEMAAALSHLYYAISHVAEAVKDVIKTTKCRRHTILNHFLLTNKLTSTERDMNKHTCCDLCSKLCDCGECCNLPLEKMIKLENANVSSDDDTASSSSQLIYTNAYQLHSNHIAVQLKFISEHD